MSLDCYLCIGRIDCNYMNHSLYFYALNIALPLMLFFGFHMLFSRIPEKGRFQNFILSRRLMGIALLILAANYSVHLFCGIRLKNVDTTIIMNMATYFICYWLFSAAMMTLLDGNYLKWRRFALHLLLWVLYSALAFAFPSAIVLFAVLLVAYGLFLAIRLLRTYHAAIKLFENTHSEDIGAYIRWLSIFTYWAIAFGVSCGLLTFLPDEYIFLWILSSIPFYIYLYCSYQNYIFFYERVESAFKEEEIESNKPVAKDVPVYHAEIAGRVEEWIAAKGYLKQGITLNELALLLCTNRTYLSEYINSVYKVCFRDWISGMRIEYAKRLMEENPLQKMNEISDASGFTSISQFYRIFSQKEGCSPAKWRKAGSQKRKLMY